MVCISHFENGHKQLFSLIKKKRKKETTTAGYFLSIFRLYFPPPCIVKLKNASVIKHLFERTGWGKIELMLIRPLGYHPAGEIWQTSAIHALPNHFVTLPNFHLCISARERGEKANPELNQRSVRSIFCLPTAH